MWLYLSQFLDINWTGLTNMLDIPGIKWVTRVSHHTHASYICYYVSFMKMESGSVSLPLKHTCCHMTYFVFWGDTDNSLSHKHNARSLQSQKCCSSCQTTSEVTPTCDGDDGVFNNLFILKAALGSPTINACVQM